MILIIFLEDNITLHSEQYNTHNTHVLQDDLNKISFWRLGPRESLTTGYQKYFNQTETMAALIGQKPVDLWFIPTYPFILIIVGIKNESVSQATVVRYTGA